MECDTCGRGYDAHRLPFNCAVDARNRIFPDRLKHVQLLIENEAFAAQIKDLEAQGITANAPSSASKHRLTAERTDEILSAAQKLRSDIQAAREEIQSRKKAIAGRRSDLASISQGLGQRREKQVNDVDKSTRAIAFRWSNQAESGAKTRAWLCQETAQLYGLDEVVDDTDETVGYQIGRVPITDLTAMNTISPDVISTSLAHISHILILAAHYLAIRLPAEITNPHRDYPRPTIFNLATSYQHSTVSFSSTPGASQASTPRESETQQPSRPRPLFIDKDLPKLSKEDPHTYNFFLEGVTLLAYDIAWLCGTQGVPVGESWSFEDICNIGRNLHALLVEHSSRSRAGGSDPSGGTAEPSLMGRFSHGTMYYPLAGAEGSELVRTFKLPSPMKLRDKLKRHLLRDAPIPDWEVLEDDAWKVDDDPESAVVVETPKPERTTRPAGGKDASGKGSNGWMRVKNR